jgi:S-adenosylmethionine hydrolase
MLLPLSDIKGAIVSGEAWWVDGYGNVQINISPEDLAEVGIAHGESVTVTVGSTIHTMTWVTSYSDAEEGEALLHVDSAGLMAVAVRGGDASAAFKVAEGVAVSLAGSRSAKAE